MKQEILELMLKMKDSEYKEFDDRLVNNKTGNPSIGIRVPALKKICRDIAAEKYGEIYEFFREMDKALKEEPETIYQEEHLLYGMLIGMGDMWPANREHCMEHWIPTVMSWKDCDSSLATWKFVEKDKGYWYPYFYKWLDSGNEMAVRTALVAYMDYYVEDEYIDRLMEVYSRDYSSMPYAKKAQAWAISVCYIKYPEKVIELLKSGKLKDSAQNLAIQKCIDSYRVDKASKEELKKYKRKRGHNDDSI